MDIELTALTIGDIVNGYVDNDEEGVFGFGGKLNIRPKYQREFVYKDKQEKAVIDTIFKNYPLNVMYWVENEDGCYEVLDGQQRTISFCSYFIGNFMTTVNGRLAGFYNLTEDEKKQFLGYELQIYICKNGTDKDRLDWFRTINIAGVKLTEQELRNATYPGIWVTEAKRKFSKNNCVAKKIAANLISKAYDRQEVLELVLKWIADKDEIAGKDAIDMYMSIHQHDCNADREWQYFQNVVAWVRSLFPNYRKEMKGLDWGLFYNRYKDNEYSATELEKHIKALMLDSDVTNKKGIYEYLLSGNERCLSLRLFDDAMKNAAYERQNGICPHCGKHYLPEEMEGDHITPWSEGGHTTADNCQMLCKTCNRIKGCK